MLETAARITTRPLAPADLPRLWEFMGEFPGYNFDDSGPGTFARFERQIAERIQREFLIAFDVAGELIGAIAVQPVSRRAAMLRGVCFSRAVHGTGIPVEAVGGAIAALFADGVQKISGQMFADNGRAWRFFEKLGAVEEGLLRAHTTRAGELVDVRIIAFFAPTHREN